MNKLIHILWVLLFVFGVWNTSYSQCSNCNSQWPTGTQSTTSTSLVSVSTCMYGGEYAVFDVVSGETYTWTTCGDNAFDTQLTLISGSGCGGGNLSYNDDDCGVQSTITWVASFTGQVTVLISEFNCLSNSTCMELQWACLTCGGGGGGITAPGSYNTCSDVFYDTGGAGGNYSSGQNYTVTICPDGGGDCVIADFVSFATESCCDELYIYDGNSTAAPLLGQYQGTNSPGTVTATAANASGCLTFEFISDGSVQDAGWEANISCGACAPDPNAPISTCSDVFYDNGGAGGNYSSNQNYSVTYCPDGGGDCIIADFISFATESCCDDLNIYDGNSTAAPLLGQFQGTNSPGTIAATINNASGCLTFEFISDGSFTDQGWEANISCGTCAPDPSAPITTCNDTYYDSGGAGGDYSSGENTTVTYCPSTAGDCIEAAFSSFNTESGYDYLNVYNGTSTSDPLLGAYSGSGALGTVAANINNASGCLTFEFVSDGGIQYSGWEATISCVTCDNPPPTPPEDCTGGQTICDDSTLPGNSSGIGNQELTASNEGCLSGENQSSWYAFSPSADGQVEFTITPTASVDYDFAIWGPYADGSTLQDNCVPSTSPIRCSWSSIEGPTGLQAGAGDVSEGAGGDSWVDPLNVLQGEVYILLIDNYDADNTSFNLDWNLSGGAGLDCTILPIEWDDFYGEKNENNHHLYWSLLSESTISYFELEHSTDAFSFNSIYSTDAKGFTHQVNQYDYLYENPPLGISYYRIKSMLHDGSYEYSDVISLENYDEMTFNVVPNPFNGKVRVDFNFRKDQDYSIVWTDISGRVVNSVHQKNQSDVNSVYFDFSSQSAGVYFCKLLLNGVMIDVKKVVKE